MKKQPSSPAQKGEKKSVSGILQLTRRGMGYLPWPQHQDIEIENVNLSGGLNGDTVEVALTGLLPRPKGKVVRVVSRAKEEFVATLKTNAGKLVGVPDDFKMYRPIQLSGTEKYIEGEKVLIKLISFDGKNDPKGIIIEHLGHAGEHKVEMNAIVLEHGFRTDFPSDTEAEAGEIEKNHTHTIEEESKKRSDFRDTLTFTIDPVDAKDFDDAISFVDFGNDEYEVGIHIADVTHFVRPGMALEHEAQKRGTSVYLVDSTIPMLPHGLSAGVCSLKQDEDRLAFGAIFKINKKGEILARRFEKTIIRSNKRFTYEEAQQVLNSGNGPLSQELEVLRALSRILHKEREREGTIDFGDNEVRFELDKDGKPLRVVRKKRLETMSLIEEFMLLANREVATYISNLAKKVPERNYVFLYRIHDAPKEDRIEELATFVRAIGYEFGHRKKTPTTRDIAKLLRDIEGKPEASLIRTATLRSMAKAIYSTKNIGHFGLAFEYYTHFTSPIRRYPDMLVHRILASHLNGKPLTRKEFDDLENLCIHASLREAEAVEAERESIRYKQVEYMQGKIGQEFDGVISGVTDWGLYVEEKTSAAEGLVPVRTIGNDFYNYSSKEYALIGQRTKKKYTLGDALRVKLVSADLISRQLEFALI